MVSRRVLVLALFAIAGCGGSSPPTEVPTASAVVSRTRPPCEGEASCRVVSRTPAGHDASGVELFVVETEGARYSLDSQQPTTNEDEAACLLREFWLEKRARWELVLTLCNDGYGASGVGDDQVEVRDNRLVHDQMGGSAWRWGTTNEWQLSPRQLLRVSEDGYWAVGRNAEERRLDYTTFRGRVSWYSPVCGHEDEELPDDIGTVPAGHERSYVMLPLVAMDSRFDPATTALGACATTLDGSDEGGFLLGGEPGRASDASVEIVAIGMTEVVVVVHDDVLVRGSDVLTIAWSDTMPSYYEHCLDDTIGYATVVFDAATGAVVHGDAAPIAATTGTAPNGRFFRFRLTEESAGGGLTVAYTDADAGGAVERTFASSPLREGDVWSLGARAFETNGRTECVVRGGSLARVHHDEPVTRMFAAP